MVFEMIPSNGLGQPRGKSCGFFEVIDVNKGRTRRYKKGEQAQ